MSNLENPRKILETHGFQIEDGERWEYVPDYPEYMISSNGRVVSLKHGKVRLLKLQPNTMGRLHFVVSVGNRVKTIPASTMVARVFIGPKPDGLLVLHRDDVKTNNRASNLYYGNQSQNLRDCIRNGNHRPPVGSRNGMAKLDEEKVSRIRSEIREETLRIDVGHERNGLSQVLSGVAQRYGMSVRQIRDIHKNLAWKEKAR